MTSIRCIDGHCAGLNAYRAGARESGRTRPAQGNCALLVSADHSPENPSPTEIRELWTICRDFEAAYAASRDRRPTPRGLQTESLCALWLCLATGCRIGELLMTRWEHLDLGNAVWFVPASNTKTRVDWYVFLSDFALRHFRLLQTVTGQSQWCYPSSSVPLMFRQKRQQARGRSTDALQESQTAFKKTARRLPCSERRSERRTDSARSATDGGNDDASLGNQP